MGTLIGSTFTFQGNIEMVATDIGSTVRRSEISKNIVLILEQLDKSVAKQF